MVSLSQEKIINAWRQYQSYFLDKEIQANIQLNNEEQYQEGFLRKWFLFTMTEADFRELYLCLA